MKKPKTLEELKTIISMMEHRERFCFELKEQTDAVYMMEMYCADTDGNMFEDQKTITFQTVDPCGKWDKKFNFKTSMKRRILLAGDWSGKFEVLNKVLELIK